MPVVPAMRRAARSRRTRLGQRDPRWQPQRPGRATPSRVTPHHSPSSASPSNCRTAAAGSLRARSAHGPGRRDGKLPASTAPTGRAWRTTSRAAPTASSAVALVTDSFGAYEEALLRASFHRVLAFKQHFVADLTQPLETSTSANHRRNARAALRRLTVDVPANREACLDDWCALYERLAAERRIVGIRRFSAPFVRGPVSPAGPRRAAGARGRRHGRHAPLAARRSSRAQPPFRSKCPRVRAVRRLRAALARPRALCRQVRWLHLGAGPGVTAQADDGVSSFKRGWATGTRPAYFCGRICAPERYRELVRVSGTATRATSPPTVLANSESRAAALPGRSRRHAAARSARWALRWTAPARYDAGSAHRPR